ncbi:hypothetical protein C4F17_25410 [Variovorax sp. PMC12]|nr:hypothetical protein C4F17_25410 [Variovorax sp. PMC12]
MGARGDGFCAGIFRAPPAPTPALPREGREKDRDRGSACATTRCQRLARLGAASQNFRRSSCPIAAPWKTNRTNSNRA